MTINKEALECTLVAVPYAETNKNKCGDVKALYSTYQKSLTEYEIVLSEKFETNELFRVIVNFLKNDTKKFNVLNINIDLNSFFKATNNKRKEQIVEIVTIATEYATVTPYSKKMKKATAANVNLIVDSKFEKLIEERLVVAQAQTLARRLQDMPSNEMVPGTFVQEVKKIFAENGVNNVEFNVIERKELEAKGFNLLVGVGQAAEKDNDQPRLLTITYKSEPKSNDLTAFVGKGVCFDTGGLNIKVGGHMRWMKYDMSGAAIVSMTLLSLAKNKVKGNYVAVCPLVINLCDTEAQRPDDVIISYSGKSVEIDNTDAEGRLILADALTYTAKDLKASRIFDIATLTGAMIYSLGDTYSGLWTNSDEMWEKISHAAEDAGELVWRMPFHKDFIEMLNSNVADIVNSVSDPRGGSSRAACFLKEFTEDLPYAHFDVAATATKNNLATGIILNTFYNFAKNK